VREFFAVRGVLEVETPQLCPSTVTDPAIETLAVLAGRSLDRPRFLQTSPEYAMKRLLAAFGEPIYQIARVFRDGEVGKRHNPEFTLLEWYRPGLEYHALMDEVAELVCLVIGARPTVKLSYREVFARHLQVDPLLASDDELRALAVAHVDVGQLDGDRDLWLDLLMSHVIEPQLSGDGLHFIYDYPASQAALSEIATVDGARVGQRFELYVDGIELANGYLELLDAQEQRQRFDHDNERRRAQGASICEVDEKLLAALAHGLPRCSGVAMGLDRLLMLALTENDIRNVLAFDWTRA